MKLRDIALLVGGRVIGDEEFKVEGVSSCDEPKPKTLVFCQDPKSAEKSKGKEVALVVSEPIEHSPLLLVEDVRYAMAVVLNALYPERHPVGVSSLAYVGKDVSLGEDVYIAPFVYVGDGAKIGDRVKIYPFSYIGDNCFIGDDTVIFSGVCIYPKSVIGKGVRIHSGAVIGADGFGYHIGKEGITKLPHIGIVVVEDNVEIGANTTIDRALLDRTVIGKNTKIDNLVMIGHNCKIGENNIIVSQVGLSGSVKTGKNVVLAGQVGVADHISIGDNVVVAAKAGVSKDLEANKVYGGGIPAMEWSKWKRIHAYILKLPELFKSLSKSERKSGE